MNAQKSLSSISANRDLWIAQYRQEMAERDKRSSINSALRRGIAQGMREAARNALALGLSAEKVAAITGLSAAEVAVLSGEGGLGADSAQNV